MKRLCQQTWKSRSGARGSGPRQARARARSRGSGSRVRLVSTRERHACSKRFRLLATKVYKSQTVRDSDVITLITGMLTWWACLSWITLMVMIVVSCIMYVRQERISSAHSTSIPAAPGADATPTSVIIN